MSDANVECVAQHLLLSSAAKDGMLVWFGEFSGRPVNCRGSNCLAVCPSIVDVDGEHRFAFDSEQITHLDVSLDQEPDDDSRKTVIENLCFICRKEVELVAMRDHVGRHILRKV